MSWMGGFGGVGEWMVQAGTGLSTKFLEAAAKPAPRRPFVLASEIEVSEGL